MASPLLARCSSHGASAFGSVGATSSLLGRGGIAALAVLVGPASFEDSFDASFDSFTVGASLAAALLFAVVTGFAGAGGGAEISGFATSGVGAAVAALLGGAGGVTLGSGAGGGEGGKEARLVGAEFSLCVLGARLGRPGTGGRFAGGVERSLLLALLLRLGNGGGRFGAALAGGEGGRLGMPGKDALDALPPVLLLLLLLKLGSGGGLFGVGAEKLGVDVAKLLLGAAGAREWPGMRYCAVTAPAVMASAIATAMMARRLVLRREGGSGRGFTVEG